MGKTLESITSAFGEWWKTLVNDGQLRWLGPEKGVMHMAVGALVNAVWDLWGKHVGKPVWRLLFDLTPEEIISLIDFRWYTHEPHTAHHTSLKHTAPRCYSSTLALTSSDPRPLPRLCCAVLRSAPQRITDAITPGEALLLLQSMQANKEERLQYLLKHGYRAYTTSAGWLGYTEAQLREKCRAGVQEGWTHFKAKVGVSLEEDKERIRVIREEIGDRTLMVDANQRWDVGTAIEYMKELSVFKPWFIEEPTCADDILGHLAIKNALKPYNVAVATGEVCHNRVMFKQVGDSHRPPAHMRWRQRLGEAPLSRSVRRAALCCAVQFIMSGAMDICQIDSCRVAGVNEILSILLIAAKYKVPVCPHAGGVGLCEYVQHLAMFDFLCISGRQNIIEYVNHLHEHFKYPCDIRDGCYMAPQDAGYSIEMFPQSVADYTFPTGKEWVGRIKARQSRGVASLAGHNTESSLASIHTTKEVDDAAAALPQSTAAATTTASGAVWLITGAQGFVGGWVIKALLDEFKTGVRIVAHDLRHDDHILAQILSPLELSLVQRVYCDISNTQATIDLITQARPTHIVHLAGLQIPTCRANPPLGAQVNVLGTVNVFEAAARLKATHPVRNIVYASSAALYGPGGDYPRGAVPEEFNHKPRTLYGVYKQANEGTARVYWQDQQIVSVGLRMMTVYGVGREVGMTSGPTKAIKSAVLGRPMFELTFKGKTSFNDVRDVARLFVDSAKKAAHGAVACGVKGVEATVEHFMAVAEKVVPELKGKYKITAAASELPFPSESAPHPALSRSGPPRSWYGGSADVLLYAWCACVLVVVAASMRVTWQRCWAVRCPCPRWRTASLRWRISSRNSTRRARCRTRTCSEAIREREEDSAAGSGGDAEEASDAWWVEELWRVPAGAVACACGGCCLPAPCVSALRCAVSICGRFVPQCLFRYTTQQPPTTNHRPSNTASSSLAQTAPRLSPAGRYCWLPRRHSIIHEWTAYASARLRTARIGCCAAWRETSALSRLLLLALLGLRLGLHPSRTGRRCADRSPALLPLQRRARDDAERVQAARELRSQCRVDRAVARDEAQTVEGRRHHHHFEVRLTATRHTVHPALVDHLQVRGIEARAQRTANVLRHAHAEGEEAARKGRGGGGGDCWAMRQGGWRWCSQMQARHLCWRRTAQQSR